MSRTLVVDESPVILKVAARVLADAGIEVTGALTAAEAETSLRATPGFDLVILSGAMADAPADRVLREMRAWPDYAKIPVFVSITETNLGLMTRCRRAGATGFIYRPFDRAALLGWLADHLPVKAAA